MISVKKSILISILFVLLLSSATVIGIVSAADDNSEYITTSGPDGSENVEFDYSTAIAVDDSGKVFVDSSGNVLIVEDSGKVYVDSDGNTYVSDWEHPDDNNLKLIDAPPIEGAENAPTTLHDLPKIPYDAVPLWEGEYKLGLGEPVLEVINIGKANVSFSLWKSEISSTKSEKPNAEYYLTTADYVVNVSKGESKSIVIEEGYYHYWAAEPPYETSPWHSGSSATFDKDGYYKAVFPEETASPFGVTGLLIGLGAAVFIRRKK